jgi:cell division protein FtsQ
MPAERAPSEDSDSPRFDSNRTSPWRPASGWGRAVLSLAALALLAALGIAGYLLKTYLNRDNRFRISGASNIQATGLNEVSRAEMLPIFGEDIGRNIFFVPLSERRSQLERIPWVERATVMRLLPDQIRVSVVERQPVAFMRQGSQVGLVDANGVLLAMPPALMAQHHYSFPVVTGINPHDPPAAAKTRMAVYQRLLAELDANGQHLSEQISEIDLTDPEDARVLMPEPGADILAHFGEDRFLDRYQRYKAHIAEWRQQYPKLATVDLRYDEHVVLEMAQGADAQLTAPEANAAAKAPETKPPAAKPAQKAQAGPARKTAPKSKTQVAKDKAAKDKKKRAAAQRASLEASKKRKTSPAPATRQGQ